MTQELWYTRVERLGIVINIVAVSLYIIMYGELKLDVGFERADLITFSVMNLMALISGLFLGDALRRIWVTFNKIRGLL